LNNDKSQVAEPGSKTSWKTISHMFIFGLLLAIVMLVVIGTPGDVENEKVIFITGADAAQVHAKFMRTWNRLPTEVELKKGIEQYIKDEILYREAISRNLDESDPSVRLAMVIKITMMGITQTDVSNLKDEDIEAYYALRKERYRLSAIFDFEQVYLNKDKRGDNITNDVKQLLESLKRENPSSEELINYGDASMINNLHINIDAEGLDRIFGSGFGSTVLSIPTGEWTGPIQSGYGLHIVRITNRTESRIPELKEVLQKVITDMSYENRKAAEDQFYSELVPRYKVIYDESVIEALGGEIN
jgi:hypothetical protein